MVHTRRTAESRSTAPTTARYEGIGSCSVPPTYAAGIDPSANGQKVRHAKCPARANWIVPTVATTRLRTSAVGFIASGDSPASASTAR